MPKTSSPPVNVDEFMQLARERYAYAYSCDQDDRMAAESDVDFVAGDQWNETALKKRKKQKRPVLTWNRLQTFVAQIVNDGRENKPSIKITAMDGGKPSTAEVIQSRIRHIEYESDADIAYDTSREHQVVSGRGFYRIGTEYKCASFDQKITIEPIENQFSVLYDPAAKKYDRSDAEWAFVFSWRAREAYERRYGKTAAASASYFENDVNPAPDWIGIGPNAEQIQVAEYWLKSYENRELCLLEDLTAVYRDKLTSAQADKVMDTREDNVCVVTQYIIDGVEILDQTEFLVPFIPIVPVWGKQMMVRGKRNNFSLVRFAKDPQKLVNLYVSNIAEQIALMPKTTYIATAGQIAGFEEDWKRINEDPNTVTLYKPDSVNGELAPKPSREVNEPPIQALTLGLNQAIDGIKAAMGIFDASLGSGPGDTAGIAIEKRQKESDVANFHFSDNEARSRKYAGRILLALTKELDKGKKTIPTRDEAGKSKLVPINQPMTDEKTGETLTHFLQQGDYEVSVSTGPSYTSQREQANDAYGQIAAHDKNFMTIAGDIYFRTSDMPGADLIADRYEKMLPPQLQPQGPQGPGAQAQMARTLQTMSMQHQQLLQQVHQMAQIIETKQVESASKERIAAMQAASAERVELIKAGSKSAIAAAEREASRYENMFDRAHEAGMAAQGAEIDQNSQQADQQHQMNMQQAAQPPDQEMPEAA
jgi:hypothetical protein